MSPSPETPPPGDELDLAVAPVSSKVRSDVDRFGAFMRQIRTGYLKVGLLLMLATGLTGTLVVFTGAFSDWYMHLAMYLVLTTFGLLYIRAHLRRFRILEVFWFVLFAAMLAGFSWILIDLVPARLDVLSDRLRPDGLVGPEVGLRPAAPLLWLPVALLWAQLLWLVLHKALVAPAARRAHR
jgi:hypothetical protein